MITQQTAVKDLSDYPLAPKEVYQSPQQYLAPTEITPICKRGWLHYLTEQQAPIKINRGRSVNTSCAERFYFEEMWFGRTYLASLPGCRIIDINDSLSVISPDNKLILATDYLHHEHPSLRLLNFDRLHPPEQIDAKVLVVTGRYTVKNYWHWLFNILPLLAALKESKIPLSSFDGIALLTFEAQFQVEMLQALGEKIPAILKMRGGGHAQFRETYILANHSHEMAPHAFNIETLRKLFLPDGIPQKRERLIYISRRDAGRNIANEEEISNMLASRGFEIHVMSGMNIREQAKLFSEAKAVVAAHGSALANIVFSGPGTQVIEVQSPYYVLDYFRPLCTAIEADYYYLIGDGEVLATGDHRRVGENFVIDIEKLKKTLEMAGL